jgi:hypothetical protein
LKKSTRFWFSELQDDGVSKGKVVKPTCEIRSFMQLTHSEPPMAYKVYKVQVKRERQLRFVRSCLALGIEMVVMEMVSIKFYWLYETMLQDI